MRIRWHGHSCFEIENNQVVVTDPHDGKSIGIREPNVEADIVLVSHDHFDHNAVRLVKKSTTEVIKSTEERTIGDLKIKGIKTYHDEKQGEKRGENIIYIFETNSTKFCHLGDLGHIPSDDIIEEIKNVDFLFIPTGGTFTIGPDRAEKLLDMVKPKIAVPMHYKVGGLSLDVNSVEPFISKYPKEKIHKIGVELDFIHQDLPEETEVWVFSL
ncbi:MAG: MBL fold metallo-hydrolase [Thermoplasmatota archaeon]